MKDVLKIGAIGFPINFPTDWDIPADVTITLRVQRPDGEIFELPATRAATRVAQYVTDAESFDAGRFELSGKYRCELVFIYDGRETPSKTFIINVQNLAGC